MKHTTILVALVLSAAVLVLGACQDAVLQSSGLTEDAITAVAADVPVSRSVSLWYLENNMKNATSLSAIAGVYWSARDMDSSPVGNHHFITLVYESASQCSSMCSTYGISYKSYANQKGLTVYYTTLGAFTDDGTLSGKITEVFNQSSDANAVKEQVNPNKYIYWWKADYDLEAHKVPASACSPAFGSTESFIKAVIQKAKNFNTHYAAGQTVSYVLYDENCSCMVNSLFNSLGVSLADRTILGEMSGVDWGEEDLISADYFD